MFGTHPLVVFFGAPKFSGVWGWADYEWNSENIVKMCVWINENPVIVCRLQDFRILIAYGGVASFQGFQIRGRGDVLLVTF